METSFLPGDAPEKPQPGRGSPVCHTCVPLRGSVLWGRTKATQVSYMAQALGHGEASELPGASSRVTVLGGLASRGWGGGGDGGPAGCGAGPASTSPVADLGALSLTPAPGGGGV